jgi:excinuclease ABC subunit C
MGNLKEKLKKIPQSPGVYLFKNAQGEILYVGKADNLKNRVKSYFQSSFPLANPAKAHLLKEIKDIKIKPVQGEIEALILESRLIKKLKPRYNKLMRDDKQYFFVEITPDQLPRIFLTHQPKLESRSWNLESRKKQKTAKKNKPAKFQILNSKFQPIGPFTNGRALKTTLKTLRRIFPYCTCRKPHRRRCLNAHLGLCLGFCCQKTTDDKSRVMNNELVISKKQKQEYWQNIKNIIGILKGKKNAIIKNLEKEIQKAAQKQDYEKAAELQDKRQALKIIYEHKRVLEPDSRAKLETPINLKAEFKKNLGIQLLNLNKIEGYDISNLQGKQAVGTMVVFRKDSRGDFKPSKAEYRRFKIRKSQRPDDPKMLGEIISRRLNHPEWDLPDLILVDGGRAQLNAALKAINYKLKATSYKLAVVGLAKNEDKLYTEKHASPIPLKNLPNKTGWILQQVRDEAHRTALRYHTFLRSKQLTASDRQEKRRQM